MITYRRGLIKDVVKEWSGRRYCWLGNLLCAVNDSVMPRPAADKHRTRNGLRLYLSVKKNALAAGLAFLVYGPATSADQLNELGRLFTDASQREMLEAIRHGAYVDDTGRNSAVSSVTVNGVMMRSDGSNVIWINGRSSLQGDPANGVKVHSDAIDSATYKVPLNVDGKTVKIKPGQSWSDSAGYVKDNY